MGGGPLPDGTLGLPDPAYGQWSRLNRPPRPPSPASDARGTRLPATTPADSLGGAPARACPPAGAGLARRAAGRACEAGATTGVRTHACTLRGARPATSSRTPRSFGVATGPRPGRFGPIPDR